MRCMFFNFVFFGELHMLYFSQRHPSTTSFWPYYGHILGGHYGFFLKIDHNGPKKNDHNMDIGVVFMGVSGKKWENVDYL